MNRVLTSEMLRETLDELSPDISYEIILFIAKGNFRIDRNYSYVRVIWNDEFFEYCHGENVRPGYIDSDARQHLENRIENKIKTKYGFFDQKEYNKAWWDLKITLLEEQLHKRKTDGIILESTEIIKNDDSANDSTGARE